MGLALAYERRGSGPPGFGASPPLARGMRYDFDNLSAVLETFFASLGLDHPDVAGNSLGDLLSIKLACRGSVRSATAIAPPTFSTPLGIALMAAVIGPGILALNLPGAVGLLTRSPRLRHAAGGLVVAHPRRQDPADFLANLLALRAAPGALPLLRHNFRSLRFRGEPSVPVTIAWCARDRVVRHRYAVLASRILPTARQVGSRLRPCPHVRQPRVGRRPHSGAFTRRGIAALEPGELATVASWNRSRVRPLACRSPRSRQPSTARRRCW